MTFFVSDELKERISEKELAEVYHEEKEMEIIGIFQNEEGTSYECKVLSVEKNTKQKNLILEFDAGTNEELIQELLVAEAWSRFELKIAQVDSPLFSDVDVVMQLVKIKKINERNSYFAKIFIAL
tara:strand:- start:3427 stop:3801 length:375 start_codon:yes stop_codon:yes gene_type:complete